MLQDESPVKRKRRLVSSILLLQVRWRWWRRPRPLPTKEIFSSFARFYPRRFWVVFFFSPPPIWGRCIHAYGVASIDQHYTH